ncbi:hypothetical protein [Alkalicoccobacillus gibsonii]|uniref:hypothetical protein n=1 Tax=Alkalicoccobacillus gibsonii TaxID=79881 RepID=UPI003518ED0E
MKTCKLFSVLSFVLLIGILTACGDGGDEQVSSEGTSNEANENESAEEETDAESSQGDIDDQMNLSIGDSAVIESTLGQYEVTLNHVHYKEEVEGVMSELDGFLIANYSIENIGDDTINLMESINVLEATDDLVGTGEGNVSGSYESIESFGHDELAPGEKSTKDVLYLAYDSDDYYIRVVQGLIASEGVKNEVLFTFQKVEIE